jgi:hypothetical protein
MLVTIEAVNHYDVGLTLLFEGDLGVVKRATIFGGYGGFGYIVANWWQQSSHGRRENGVGSLSPIVEADHLIIGARKMTSAMTKSGG